MDEAENGNTPYIKAYKDTPKAHTSAAFPENPSDFAIKNKNGTKIKLRSQHSGARKW